MPVNHINIPNADSVEELRQNVEHTINLAVQQINIDKNRFVTDVDAQGNTLSNLPMPSQGGDAVPLKFLNQALEETHKKRTRRPPDVGTTKPTAFNIIFKAAIAQSGSPLLGMSFPSAAAPTGAVIAGANTLFAVELFGTNTFVQDHFPLPDDWIPNSQVDLNIYWLSTAGTAAPTWSIALAASTNGQTSDPAFNAASTAVATATASNLVVQTTMTNLNVNSILPGNMLWFKFGNIAANVAGLLELRFTLRRQI